MSRKIIIKHRRNHNLQMELTLEEFKVKFSKELRQAIDDYKADEERKNYLPPFVKPTPDYEQDFYMSLIFNFNNYAQTQYYIAQ